jgi:hypothetical protein
MMGHPDLKESWVCLVYLESRDTEDNPEYLDQWELPVLMANMAVTVLMVFPELMGVMDPRERWETMETLESLE